MFKVDVQWSKSIFNVDVQGQWSMLIVNVEVDGQSRWSMLMVKVDVQCRWSMLMVKVDVHCRWSWSKHNDGECRSRGREMRCKMETGKQLKIQSPGGAEGKCI